MPDRVGGRSVSIRGVDGLYRVGVPGTVLEHAGARAATNKQMHVTACDHRHAFGPISTQVFACQ